MASMILGSIGSSLLGPIGGFLGSALGSYIDNLLFAPKPEDIEGPRLEDTSTIAAQPGVPIPLVYGADRIPGIVVHTSDLIETVHKDRRGGKGGGGKQTVTTYTYHVDIDYMVSEGPILGIGRIWADGRIMRGTWYEMQTDTKDNFEKIGGIPYEDWYWNAFYKPEETPWSYDPTYTPTILLQKYIWNVNDGFVRISESEANNLLATTKTVVYAFDTASEKYLPIPKSHDYTGECPKEGGEVTSFEDRTSLPMITVGGQQGGVAGLSDEISGTVSLGGASDPFYPDISDNSVVVSRTAKLDISANIYNHGGDGIFDNDFGFSSFTSGEITSKGGGATASSDLDGFWVSTPSVDNAFNRPPQWPPSDSMSLSIDIDPAHTELYYEVGTASSLSSFSHTTDTTASLTITTTVRDNGPNIRDWPEYFNFYDAINDWSPKAVLQFCGSEGVAVYRGLEDQISDPTMELHAPDPDCGVPAYIGRAHIVFQRLELENFGNRIPNMTFEVVGSDNTRIRDVLTDLMTRADIDPKFYDVSELPASDVPSFIIGYTIASVSSYRSAMEPLLEAFDVDSAEIGDQIVFRPKRRSFDHTIDYNEMAAKETGSSPQPPLRLAFKDPTEVPVSLDIRYKDPERDYQGNTSRFDRQNAPGKQSTLIELPVVRQPHIMKEYTRDRMRDIWLERISGAWTLPAKYTFISPSDIVRIINSPEGKFNYTFKVTNVVRRDDGMLEFEGVRREGGLYVPADGEQSNLGTNTAFVNNQFVNNQIVTTKHFLMNLPMLSESDGPLGFYAAMSGAGNGWSGGTLYRSAGTAWDEVYATTTNARAGQVVDYNEAFNDTKQLYEVDFASRVTIRLFNPEDQLESVTDDEFFQLENVAAIGNEIIGFKNATALGDGLWELNTLLRARLDTEDHASEHLPAEDFVLLTPIELENVEVNATEIDVTNSYTSTTLNTGLPDLNSPSEEFTVTSERLKPFRPVMLDMEVAGTTCTFTWVRQNRTGFYFTSNGQGIPNSEAFERYEVDITTLGLDSNPIAVVRTFTVNDVRTVDYTSAQQTADGISSGDKFRVSVYQMSETVGRGNPDIGDFTCP